MLTQIVYKIRIKKELELFLPDWVNSVVLHFGLSLGIWCCLNVQLYIWIRSVD